jgi:hypothetical protein
MCSLHVIFLSKISPRYFMLFINGISCPFNITRESGGPIRGEKWIARVLSSLIFIFQRSPGVAYSHITKQNSYASTNVEQEPLTNQPHQQTSDIQN